jgi:hypothetical protein
VPQVDVVDSTWLGATPAVIGAVLAEPANWARWWPELRLEIAELRGPKGVRWSVPDGRRGSVCGSMEIWLQPVDDGTVVHYFLRLDGTREAIGRRAALRLEHEYRTRAKRLVWAVGERVDPGRLARVAGPVAEL